MESSTWAYRVYVTGFIFPVFKPFLKRDILIVAFRNSFSLRDSYSFSVVFSKHNNYNTPFSILDIDKHT